jgi:hypothetical protein
VGGKHLLILVLGALLCLARPSWAEGGRFSPYGSMSDAELSYAYEHTSLTGPIAVTVVGGSISALAIPIFFGFGAGSLACAAQGVQDCTPFDTVTVASGVTTAIFGTMTVVGVVWLDGRVQKRSGLKDEMRRREAQSASLGLSLAPIRGGSMLAIGGTF